MQLLNTLPREEVLLKEATQPPNDIDVTDEDLDAYIRSVPTGGGETSADAEVEEWRRQKLNKSGFSEAEFHNLMRRWTLVSDLLRTYLGERVETVVDQVLLQFIVAGDAASAQTIADRLAAGESFADLAQELNPDQLSDAEGERGRFPQETLPPSMASIALDQLAVAKHSAPMPLQQPGEAPTFSIIRVADRVAAHETTGPALAVLRSRALDSWFAEELSKHDSETDAWASWQIQRSQCQPINNGVDAAIQHPPRARCSLSMTPIEFGATGLLRPVTTVATGATT